MQNDESLSTLGRWLVLVVALLGWFGSGVEMAVTQLVGRNAMIDLLDHAGELDTQRYQQLNKQFRGAKKARAIAEAAGDALDRQQLVEWQTQINRWYARLNIAFLLGAAAGGLLFGWMGDRFGRARGMAASILTYSALAAVAYFARTPSQLVGCWFLACLGVGGMWPNGVALAAEAWSGMSRSVISGVLGVSANIGLFLMNTLATYPAWAVTSSSWRWTMLVAAAPIVLGLFAWCCVPESPRWLALRRAASNAAGVTTAGAPSASMSEVFRPPLLTTTLLAIALATVPMMGGWGSASWMQPWAAEVGEAQSPPDPTLQARVGQARAFPGMLGSLLGGWLAVTLGRRLTYFLISLGGLASAEFAYCCLSPTDPWFLPTVGTLGFFSGIYYGWLPLCLPELFSTKTRSTGTGVGFNFGRIFTALTLLLTDLLMRYFDGNYALIGRATSLIFAVGLLIIWFVPFSNHEKLQE